MAANLRGMARDNEHASQLEKGRSKLLYGMPPKGASLRTELTSRLELWGAGSFEELLLRAEAQHNARNEARRSRRTGEAARQKALRAKKLAAAGAYRKAVLGLTSATALLSADEQEHWAKKLLPRTERPEEALSREAEGSQAADNTVPTAAGGRALDGVRFAALSAPGPSGARPEHLKDAFFGRANGAASQLRKAVAEFYEVAAPGKLGDSVRWLLDSRLVFLKKKAGPAARSVRVGEFWRRVIGKKLVQNTRRKAQALFLDLRQYGIAVPGGTDVLVHFRGVLEECLRGGDGPVLACLDMDLQNAFPSLEWDKIREAVEKYIPELKGWTDWCHKAASVVHLPGGGTLLVDRGAEQGDPLGSLYCGLVIALTMERVRRKLEETLGEKPALADAWFMDDGQVFCKPELVDDFLRELDEELARVGATRGEGDHVKSVARLVGSEEDVAMVGHDWITERVRRTCKLPGNNSPIHVLGVDIGDDAARDEQFQTTTKTVACGRDQLSSIGDSATELVLTRRCADVWKVTHLLRAHGQAVQKESLKAFGDDLDKALALAIAGPLTRAGSQAGRLGGPARWAWCAQS